MIPDTGSSSARALAQCFGREGKMDGKREKYGIFSNYRYFLSQWVAG